MSATFSPRFRGVLSTLATTFTTLLMSLHADAAPLSPAETALVGGYTRHDQETRARIVLLPDRTFCFDFIGGSLELLSAGHWQLSPDGKRMQLTEVRADTAVLPVFAEPKPGAPTVGIEFDGYSLGQAEGAAFSYTADDTPPKTLRPLFGNFWSWSDTYTLPPVPSAQVKHLFIAVPEEPNAHGMRSGRLVVLQYTLAQAAQLRFGYELPSHRIDLNSVITLKQGHLQWEGQSFGQHDTLPPEVFDELRETCIKPIFARAAGNLGEGAPRPGSVLKPVKTFHLPLSAVQGEPWFMPKE